MLTAIEIENFRAFGERTRIEMAPITLIYGQNSAGKSSILQALNLLKQTAESRDSGASLLPRGGIVDLGSFRDLLFDHDPSRVLRLGLEVRSDRDQYSPDYTRRLMGPLPSTRLGITYGFAYGATKKEVGLESISVANGSLSDTFATFNPCTPMTPNEPERLQTERLGYRSRHPGPTQGLRILECTWVSDRADWWKPVFEQWLSNRTRVTSALSADRMLPAFLLPTFDPKTPMSESALEMKQHLEKARLFYGAPFTFDAFVERMLSGWRKASLVLDGFIPCDMGPIDTVRLPEIDMLSEYITDDSGVPLSSYNVVGIAQLAGILAVDALGAMFPMGPFRRPPQRWYIFTGTSPSDVGYRGNHLPDLLFRRPDLVEHANRWLQKLEVGYKLNVKPIGDKDSDLFEVRLVDTRRSRPVEVGLSDVGFGISQILPFLVQSLATTKQIISIEQPEVHIHPRLQADLGELLAECIGETFGHQFLIETHSEHLVLRLQKLVRDKRLKPSDVSVVFVERGKGGSRVKRLHLDERGEFIDEWPGGFFPERLRELM